MSDHSLKRIHINLFAALRRNFRNLSEEGSAYEAQMLRCSASSRRLDNAQHLAAIALQSEAARPASMRLPRDRDQPPGVAGKQFDEGQVGHMLAAIREEAGDAILQYFGNPSRSERDYRQARGESLQNHAGGGFMAGRGHQQQIELRHAGIDVVHPSRELHRQSRGFGAHLRCVPLDRAFAE